MYNIEGKYYSFSDKSFKKVLNKKEYEFHSSGGVIPLKGTTMHLWRLLDDIQRKMILAYQKGTITPVKRSMAVKRASTGIISDDLDNVVNPMDGKTYDSKSSYYKSIKDAGGVIVGNEKMKPKEHKIDDNQIKRDLHQTAKQLGYKL